MKITLNQAFYTVVVTGALAGASDVAADRLAWPMLAAVAVVGAVEFGGVVVSAHADRRRRLGERAVAARVVSALIALGAVTVNVWGHAGNPFQAAFFGGLSALGYGVWLLDSGARYRDAQRAAGRLEAIPPVYGVWLWLRHPGLTRRARHLALTTGADKLASVDAARLQVRTERRQTAIAATLRTRIAERVGPVMADVAVNTFDLDEVAIRLTRGADYDGLAALLAAELVPARLAPVGVAGSTVVEHEPERVPAEITAGEVPALAAGIAEVSGPVAPSGVPEIAAAPEVNAQAVERPARKPRKAAATATPKRSSAATKQAVTSLVAGGMKVPEIAALLSISERYTRQVLAPGTAGGDDPADNIEHVNGAKIEMTGVTA
ncbi:hypothetical protein AB0K00_20580 [Dactylosporangium sp. NPDC049525]|uniref:hypothetical protein n=1 Tax=Dactylosporangium sp. NPDC049525 TaxID=3154730 RepID=UPI003431809C